VIQKPVGSLQPPYERWLCDNFPRKGSERQELSTRNDSDDLVNQPHKVPQIFYRKKRTRKTLNRRERKEKRKWFRLRIRKKM
jgi:hypothetical protein